MVRNFLGEADESAANPKYLCAAPQRLYDKKRVKKVERRKSFQQAKEESEKRREVAIKASENLRERNLAEVSKIKIQVPLLNEEELIQQACDHYNGFDRNYDSYASPSSSPEFLQRICVNYLRHCLTDYEEHLDQIHGKVGVEEARSMIRSTVYYAIGDTYPHLAEECQRQSDRRFGLLLGKHA